MTTLSHFGREHGLTMQIVAGLVGAFLTLRTTATEVQSVQEFEVSLAGGQPTVVEFFHNA